MTVAILGGAGYIGSHCARYLHQQGYAVAIYDQVAHPALSDLPAAQGDISDRSRLRDFCVAHDVQAVIHCAGKIDVAESVRHPALYHRYNVTYTADVLAVLRELKIRKVIFSSSCSVYGDPQFLPLTEAHPIGPVSPYGESKVAAEALLQKAAETDQLRYVSLRFFNAAGADPDGILGENHDPETHLIPRLLRHLAEGEPFWLFGQDYPTPDGTCIRDYIHVWDLAHAHLCALRYLQAGGPSETFNLGSGRGYSVKEVIACAEQIVQQKADYRVRPRRPGDPAVLVSHSEKARQVLGWSPQRQKIETLVKDAWRFYQNEQHLSRLHY